MSAQSTAQEIRIVLVGKTGVGKSSTGNTILGRCHFHRAASSKSVTKNCSQASATIDSSQTVTVVDTPGWCDTELSEDELTQAIVKCIDMTCPGPHVFLLILTIGRFTAEEKKTVQKIQEIFGEGATRYTMILFTRGDDLEDTSIEEYLKNATSDLKALVAKCSDRYHVFNNKDTSRNQVVVLLQKIQDMVQHNGGECYTNTTYQLLEKYKKREAELQQEAEATKMEMQAREAELQRRIKLMEQEQLRQRLRETQLREQVRQQKIDSLLGGAVMVSLLEQMTVEENMRRQAEKKEKEKALNAQAAEHQWEIDLERKRHEADKLAYEREEKRRRRNEADKQRSKMERERQRFEQEKNEVARTYRAKILNLEKEREKMLRKHSKHSCLIA